MCLAGSSRRRGRNGSSRRARAEVIACSHALHAVTFPSCSLHTKRIMKIHRYPWLVFCIKLARWWYDIDSAGLKGPELNGNNKNNKKKSKVLRNPLLHVEGPSEDPGPHAGFFSWVRKAGKGWVIQGVTVVVVVVGPGGGPSTRTRQVRSWIS